jgi:uncharacterized spore protein YtfJ
MTAEVTESSETGRTVAEATAAVVHELDEVRDAMRAGRVFGDPYERDGVTVIPAARISGGGGAGGGQGESPDESGGGFGTGFGLNARPVGMIVIDRDGQVSWRPTVDATLIARSGQVLAGIIAVCVTLVLLRRR